MFCVGAYILKSLECKWIKKYNFSLEKKNIQYKIAKIGQLCIYLSYFSVYIETPVK